MRTISVPTNRNFCLSWALIFCLAAICFGQSREFDERTAVEIPERAMKRIVSRILARSFKAEKKRKIVYLAKRIGGAESEIRAIWLPAIKNIDFRLLGDEEIARRKIKVYFFTPPERFEDEYSIGFAFGHPHCSYSGENWAFRVIKSVVKIRRSGGVGGLCSPGTVHGPTF